MQLILYDIRRGEKVPISSSRSPAAPVHASVRVAGSHSLPGGCWVTWLRTKWEIQDETQPEQVLSDGVGWEWNQKGPRLPPCGNQTRGMQVLEGAITCLSPEHQARRVVWRETIYWPTSKSPSSTWMRRRSRTYSPHFVRLKSEYASVVWSFHPRRHKAILETIQGRETKTVHELRALSHSRALAALGWPTLDNRRLKTDKITTYNFSKGLPEAVSEQV